MARRFPVKFVRTPQSSRSRARLGLVQLEDRTTPAPLFAASKSVANLSDTSNFSVGQAADFNGDGKLDFVAGDYTSGKVHVFPGNGDGTFATATVISTNTTNLNYLAAGDMNGDGKLDLVTSYSNNAGTFRILLGDGMGAFSLNGSFSSGGARAVGIAVGDLDGNSSLDIAVVNCGRSDDGTGGGLVLFLNSNGDAGTWTQSAKVSMGVDSNSLDPDGNPINPFPNLPLAVAIGGMNNDTHQDVVAACATAFVDPISGVGGQSEGTLFTFTGDGAGSYSGVGAQTTGGTATLGLTLGDVNGDGLLDAVVANSGAQSQSDLFGNGNFGVLVNSGSGFSAAKNFGTGSTPFSVTVGDFNGDGKGDFIGLDIAGGTISSPTNGKVYAFLGNGTGTSFSPADQSPYGLGYAGGQFLIQGDYDANGLPDIVTVGVKPDVDFGMLIPGGGRADYFKNNTTPPAATTTTLSADVNPSSYGQSVTFTAQVQAATGAATGTVAFYDNGVQIGTGTLDTNSPPLAMFTISVLGVGTHPITAKFLGSTGFAASAFSNSVSQAVNQATSSTTLSANPTSGPPGTNIVFTAVVTSPTAPVSGTVKFFDGANLLSTSTLASGTATFNTTTLSSGPHTITAQYVGTANIQGSTSSPVDVQIGQLATTTGLTSSLNPSTIGQSVTFTATVTAGSGTPTGSVTFTIDGGSAGTVTLNASGVATLTTSALAAGSHTVVADYGGAAGYTASTSGTLTQAVNATTTTGLTSSLNPSTVGQAVTFTATVTSGAGTPTGSVTFTIDGNNAGTVTLNAGGVAALTTSTLTAGTHAVVAQYAGATGFAASTSGGLTQTVAAATTTTVTSNNNPSTVGQSVTLTATVTSGSGTPTGTVTFFIDGSPAQTVGLNASGVATFTTSTLTAGSHAVVVDYGGATTFNPSTSGTLTQAVNALTATSLSSSLNPSTFGQAVTFTATVTSGAGTPTGSVTFTIDGSPAGIIALNAGGVAAYSTSSLGSGTHTVVAQYGGATGFAGSTSGTVTQTVNVTTTTTMTSSLNPSAEGQAVTFTATVTPALGTPTGSVTFTVDGTPTQTVSLNASGVAAFTTSTLAAGTHTVVAQYAGATGFAASASGPLTQTVSAATTTTLASSQNPSTFGQSVTFTATVASGSGTPTGSVTFRDGAATLATVALDAAGVATFTTGSLALGGHAITASYGGAALFGVSSNALTQTVNAAATTTALTSGLNPSTFGQSVTLTATVTSGAGTPGGTVTFRDGAATLGTANLDASGVATLDTVALAAGSHTLTAVYAGGGNFAGSTSAGVSQAVNPAATATALTSSLSPTTAGQSVTFTATVTSATGTPGGTVTFFDGAASLGTGTLAGGVATLTTGSLAVGSHTVTAQYAANGNFAASTSPPVTQTVAASMTLVSVVSSLPTALFSQPVTFTATLSHPTGTPTGVMRFLDGSTTLGTAPITTVGGQLVAAFTTSALGIGGNHFITASYDGPATPPGFGVVMQTVTAVPTTVTAGVSPATSLAGKPVTLTAAVGVPAGVTASPTGAVTFRVGGTVLGTAPVSGGTATVVTSALPVGTNTVTATYEGDAVTTTSLGTATATVNVSPPVVLLGSREFGVGAGAGMAGIARFFNPDASERYSTAVFPGFTGGVRVTSADFNGDGIADLVAGSGPGTASVVVILDGKDKHELFRVNPYESSFLGGVYVAAGDVSGDGVPDVAISPDEGGGPRVRMFSGAGFNQIDDFFGIDDPAFRGGARVAVGDVNGDGVADLVVSAGFQGGPRVAGFDGLTLGKSRTRLFADLFVFEPELRNGAFLAVGDVDGDGRADVIGGGGPGGAPRVTAFSGADLVASNTKTVLSNFFAGDVNNRGGIRLVARNLDGDRFADLVTGDGTDAGSRVTGYLGTSLRSGSPTEAFAFDAFPGFSGGVYVG